MNDPDTPHRGAVIAVLTARIAVSWCEGNRSSPEIVPAMVGAIAATLSALDGFRPAGIAAPSAAAPAPRPAPPRIDPRATVFPGKIICMECAREFRTLKRHLNEAHGLSTDRYRIKWNLPDNYPMAAPDFRALMRRKRRGADRMAETPTSRPDEQNQGRIKSRIK